MLLGLVVIAAGTLLRVAPGVGALFAGTVLVGVGGGLANVFMPAAIKRAFRQRAGPVTGLQATAVVFGASAAAATSVPLAQLLGGWRTALAAPAAPTLLAAVCWVWAFAGDRGARREPPPATPAPVWRSSRAWVIAGFMGYQAVLYYAGMAWLPAILRDGGRSAAEAGTQLALFNVVGLLPTLVVGGLIASHPRGWMLTPLAVGMAIIGLTGLVVAPPLSVLWVVLFGLAQGTTMGLGFAFVILHADDPAHTARLAGMSQFVGYLLAAAAPSALGALHQATGSWTWPLAAMALANLPGLALGLAATRR